MLEKYQKDPQPLPQPDVTPTQIAVETTTPQAPQGDPGVEIPDDSWFCRPAPHGDEQKFQALLEAMRAQYASPDFNQEIAVWDDHTCRSLTTAPFKEQFTPDGLLYYASKIRGPFTFNGKLTNGGKMRAQFLLCRERMLAAKVTGREPEWKKLKDVLPSHVYETKVRAGLIKE